jgi:hypothetical protein
VRRFRSRRRPGLADEHAGSRSRKDRIARACDAHGDRGVRGYCVAEAIKPAVISSLGAVCAQKKYREKLGCLSSARPKKILVLLPPLFE